MQLTSIAQNKLALIGHGLRAKIALTTTTLNSVSWPEHGKEQDAESTS